MSESQSHGFLVQYQILENIYGYIELDSSRYTSKHDLCSDYNDVDPDRCNISIKTTLSKKRVDMGDARRVFNSLNEDNLNMIVVHLKQVDTMKKIESVVQVNLTAQGQLLFGNITCSDIETLDSMVKQKDLDNGTRKLFNIHLNEKSKYIQFNIKIDSKQRRLQCSFFDFPTFMKENPSLIVHRSDGPVFRGVKIEDVESGKRKRNKKNKNIQ